MRWTIDNSTLPAYLHVKIDGPFTTEAFTMMCRSVLASEQWRHGFPILINNKNICDPHGHESASETLSHALEIFEDLSRSISSSCIAILIGPEADFVKARQLQFALLMKDLPANIQIFFTEEDAVKWIGHCGCGRREDPPS